MSIGKKLMMYKVWHWFGKNCKWNYKIYLIWKYIGKLFYWERRLEIEIDGEDL
jgi:hypothetical protein